MPKIPLPSCRRRLLTAAFSLSLGLSTYLPATAARAESTLPPLVQPATKLSLPGKIVFAQLTTPDLDASKRFYGALLGWTFRDVPVSEGRYAIALANGRPVAGIVERAEIPAHGRPLWLPFLSVADPAAAARTAES